MTYLIDTHIFLWSVIKPKNISQKSRKILNDLESTKCVSVISFWEISLKFSLDKIDLAGIVPEELPDIAKASNFDILDLDVKTASSYYKLPKTNHKDPFDRMLAWQAIRNDFHLLTHDSSFAAYKAHGLKIV